MRASPDDVLGMAYFARVVEARSFSDAARALKVSKSAVSARVARLEERLGLQLLHRTTRRLALTADGVRLYERCARVIAEADEAAEIAAGASAAPRGVLRVHAPGAFAEAFLTARFAELMQLHPSVRIELRLGDHVPDLSADQIDVAIAIAGRLTDSGLTTRKLGALRMTACASPSYLRRKGIPFRPQDLVLHDCMSHAVRQDIVFQTAEGAISMTSLSRLVTDDASFLRAAALEGLGIVVLPEFLVADHLATGRLHRVLEDSLTASLAVHALHPHGKHAPASVRVFLELLATAFRDPPWDRATAVTRPSRTKRGTIPMTEQDVRRLAAVARLYADVEGAAELQHIVGRAKVTAAAKFPRSTVTMNSRVRLDGGRPEEVSLVYPWAEGISVLSPFGLALLGATVGDDIRDGKRTTTLAAIPYQPEAAGDHHL